MVDYRIFDRDKFTIVGNPSITDDGIASEFSNGRGLNLQPIKADKNFTIIIPFIFKHSSDTQQLYNSTIGNTINTRYGLTVNILNSNKIQISYTVDGVSWGGNALSAKILQDGGKYILKINYDKSSAKLTTFIAENGTDFIQDIVINSLIYENYGHSVLGSTYEYTQPFQGSIDLKLFVIEVDGVEVFSGSHLANTAEKLQYLKDSKEIIRQSIEAKGVEVPIETPFRQYADKIREIPSGGGSSRNRYLEFIGSPSSYPEVTDGILKARLNTKSLSDNIISSSNNLSSDDINTVDIVIPITFNNLTVGTDNNIFFGSYQTSTTNGFCLGINRTNNKLGLWVMNNSTWVFRGEQSTTSDAGETSLTLETNKKYYIRLQMNRLTSSTSQYIVSYKNNISDDFIEVFNKTSNRAIIGDWNTVTYGSTTILGIYFYCDADIDVKNATLDINTNTTRIVRIGD